MRMFFLVVGPLQLVSFPSIKVNLGLFFFLFASFFLIWDFDFDCLFSVSFELLDDWDQNGSTIAFWV